MKIEENCSLEHLHTFRIPVKTRWFMEYANEEELGRILRDEYFQSCESVHIGGGSNLLFLQDYPGIVLHSIIRGCEVMNEDETNVWLKVGAGECWDEVVSYAVNQGWGGIENLSLIPGEAGAAAVQNIGAYGVEIADVVDHVDAYHRKTGEKRCFFVADCCYGYRDSIFKQTEGEHYIVTHVTLRLNKQPVYKIQYGNLQEELSGFPLTLEAVRTAVMAIRRRKLPDPAVLGNAGSFFKNPVILVEQYEKLRVQYPTVPSYPVGEGKIKVPAGWLIEQCGFKGAKLGHVGVYEKQALVLVNLGEATGKDVADAARQIQDTVQQRFGIEISPEVKYI